MNLLSVGATFFNAIFTPWWRGTQQDSDYLKDTCHGGTHLFNGHNKTTASLVSQAHTDLHFQKMIVLVASTNDGDPVGRIWTQNAEVAPLLSCIEDSVVRAWQIQGYSLANVVILEYSQGWVLFDAAESTNTSTSALEGLAQALSTWRSDNCTVPPTASDAVSHILITHHHTDHTGGVTGVEKWNNGRRKPLVVVHELTYKAILDFYVVMTKSKFKRAVKQFGSSLVNERISAGIGASYPLHLTDPPQLIFPTHTWSGDRITLPIYNDLEVELIHMPGETSDQVCFFVKKLSLFHFADNFYFSFPNVYPLRGGAYRSPAVWKDSLDLFLREYWENTRVITVGHTSAVFGRSAIRYVVERYRDALAFIHHQTVRLLDKTSNLNLIADHVNTLFWATFPTFDITRMLGTLEDVDEAHNKAVFSNMLTDPLMPYYGQVEWAVKAIGTAELGWFSGKSVDINAHRLSPSERTIKAAQFMRSIANNTNSFDIAVLSILDRYIARGECQWALELIELLRTGDGEHHISEPIPISQCVTPETEETLSAQAISQSAKKRMAVKLADEAISTVANADFVGDTSSKLYVTEQQQQQQDSAENSSGGLEKIYGDTTSGDINNVEAAELLGRRPPGEKNVELEVLIKEEWKAAHCTALDMLSDVETAESLPHPAEFFQDALNCLRNRSLVCLANYELSASGRNWYHSEVINSDEDMEKNSVLFKLRDMVVEHIRDMDPVIMGLSYRFVPFGNKRDPKQNLVFYLTLIPDEPVGLQVDDLTSSGFTKVEPLESKTTTYEILYRNQVFNVRKINSANELDWYAIMNYKSFDIQLKWSGLRAMFLRHDSAPRLIFEGKIRLPTEYPAPIIALQEGHTDDKIRQKVRSVYERKSNFSITERIRMFIQFTEIMLSLEAK